MERLGLNKNTRIKNEIKRYWKAQSNQRIHLKEAENSSFFQEERTAYSKDREGKNSQELFQKEEIENSKQKVSRKEKMGNLKQKLSQTEKGEKNTHKSSKRKNEKLLETPETVIEKHKNLKKKRRRRKFIFCLCVFVPILLFELFTKLIEPSIIAMCEIRANSIGVSVSNKAIKQVMEEVGYDMDLVKLEKDEAGNILALQANVVEMNYISSLIGSRTQQMYNELTEAYVKIPIGNFTGNALLAGHGPSIQVKIVPVGTVGSDFKTEFVSTGINQTRHRVYLQVISSMRVIAPFTTKTIKVVNNVNVAETVLIGDVPNSYYNLEGVDNVVDDSLNLWDE